MELISQEEILATKGVAEKDAPFDEALYYSPEEYLLQERRYALDRHEYHNGKIYTMPGASKKHNIIASNLNYELQTYVRQQKSKFVVFQSDLRVHNPTTGRYFYPDIAIAVTETMQFADTKEDILLNPHSIIEILSKSTENYERTEKFDAYKGIESLQEYILVSQHTPHMEIYTRKNRLEWLYTEEFALDGAIFLRSVGLQLRLEDVYAKVSFERNSP